MQRNAEKCREMQLPGILKASFPCANLQFLMQKYIFFFEKP